MSTNVLLTLSEKLAYYPHYFPLSNPGLYPTLWFIECAWTSIHAASAYPSLRITARCVTFDWMSATANLPFVVTRGAGTSIIATTTIFTDQEARHEHDWNRFMKSLRLVILCSDTSFEKFGIIWSIDPALVWSVINALIGDICKWIPTIRPLKTGWLFGSIGIEFISPRNSCRYLASISVWCR